MRTRLLMQQLFCHRGKGGARGLLEQCKDHHQRRLAVCASILSLILSAADSPALKDFLSTVDGHSFYEVVQLHDGAPSPRLPVSSLTSLNAIISD